MILVLIQLVTNPPISCTRRFAHHCCLPFARLHIRGDHVPMPTASGAQTTPDRFAAGCHTLRSSYATMQISTEIQHTKHYVICGAKKTMR